MASNETEYLDRCIQAFEAIKLIRATYASSEDAARMCGDIVRTLEVARDEHHPSGSICQGVAKVLREHFVQTPQWPSA